MGKNPATADDLASVTAILDRIEELHAGFKCYGRCDATRGTFGFLQTMTL